MFNKIPGVAGDHGILSTTHDYSDMLGVREGDFAIVEIGPGDYMTYTHEAGHLFGGHHQNTPGCYDAHTYAGKKSAIYATTQPLDRHYSNPDVILSGGVATGTSGRNNAVVIQSHFCNFSDAGNFSFREIEMQNNETKTLIYPQPANNMVNIKI